MTEQLDWVGDKPVKKFKDIRNQRDVTAERKARLCLEIGELCKRIPDKIKGGGYVEDVREWKKTREATMKVAGNKRATIPELEYALRNMQGQYK